MKIFGIGYGLHFNYLLSPQKSVMTHTVGFFFGMINVGIARSDEVTLANNPIDSNQLVLSFVIC